MGEKLLLEVRRIDRKDDKNVYQPKIHADKIHKLYEIGKQYNLPMTVILNQAVDQFIEQISEHGEQQA